MTLPEHGVLYIATGDELRSEAAESAERVSELTDLPITIVTDQKPESTVFDRVSIVRDPTYSLRDKVMNMRLPYDRTLFLDTDTYLCDAQAGYDLLEMLDEYDIAAAHDTGRNMELTYGDDEKVPQTKRPKALPMVNTGVLALSDNSNTQDLLRRWKEIYDEQDAAWPGLNDQGAFREALIETEVNLGTVPPEYNFRAPKPQFVFGAVRVVHGHATNLPEIAEKINESPEKRRLYRPIMRLDDPTERQYIQPQIDPGKWSAGLQRLKLTAKYDGLLKTAAILSLGGFNRGRMRLEVLADTVRSQGATAAILKVSRKVRTGLGGQF